MDKRWANQNSQQTGSAGQKENMFLNVYSKLINKKHWQKIVTTRLKRESLVTKTVWFGKLFGPWGLARTIQAMVDIINLLVSW